MAISGESLRLQAQLDASVQAVTDAQTRALVAAWVYAWSEVSADLADTLLELYAPGGTITRAVMFRSVRLRTVLARIADKLDDLAAESAVTITSDLKDVVDAAARAQTQIVRAQLPDDPAANLLVDRAWTRADDDALERIVARSTEQITSLTRPLSADADRAVRRELVRSIAVGDGARETARRMVRRTEGRFNGGLTRAMTISRTELLDAYRAGAEHGQARHTDVLTGWVWLAHLDTRICPACLARHGDAFDADVPGPQGHQNCRCARMPRTSSWADLGFDVDEPEDQVDDARVWFDALPEAEQIQLLGRRRWQLLTTGQVGWADLATRRTTPQWRDSWGVTPVRDLAQRSGGRAAS